MRIAIMQPYFLPYIGYWQLIGAADAFVVYDNIKYTKKGWINRNRFLLNAKEALFSLPLRKGSDFLDVNQRYLADSFDREDLLNRFREAYRKAPEYSAFMPTLEDIVRCPSANLFDYVRHSIEKVCSYLELRTPVIVSSAIDCDHSLKAAERVQAICKALGAKTYINLIGGVNIYNNQRFNENGIDLKFLKSEFQSYPHASSTFVPWLSIIDVIMFNNKMRLSELLNEYHFEQTHFNSDQQIKSYL